LSDIFDKKGISVFGVSSFGQFIDKDHDTDSIAMMLLEIKPEYFKMEFFETGNSSTKEIAKAIGEKGKKFFNKPAFIIASGGIKTDGEKIIEGIQEAAGKDVTIFGGLAASDFKIMETFVFTNGKISDNGLLAIILNEEKISVRGYATGGSQPVGIYHTITKSEGNIVYTIDDQPAIDLVLRYCGKGNDELKSEIDMLNIASYFQIQLDRGNASPIMRTPMFANLDERSLVFAGSLPQGSKVKFSILPGFEVVDNLVAEFTEYSKNAGNADAVILFSCAGREIAFGPYMSDEIDRLNKIWNSPMIGLFSFGEIGRGQDGKYEFYNMTCSLALLKENDN
ncbi:MAG TPA: FIST N-terminal domain-containing protein, partial [Chitinophagaceae bacterium]|nr:FIST N-terminal domain-containing protein [Chitinophagaceae bacterium]